MEEEDNDGDTIDPGDLRECVRDELEVLATCMDNVEHDAPIPGVDASQLQTACLKLAELTEARAVVQAARRGASDSNRHSCGSSGGKGETRPTPGRQRVPSSARDQRHHDARAAQVVEGLNVPGPNLSNAEVRSCKQSWTSGKLAAFAMRVTSTAIGSETLGAPST